MFSQAFVCSRGGVPHVTITHDALDPTVPTPPLLLTSGNHHWRPVQTCSLEDLPSPPPHNQYFHLVVVIKACTVGKRAVRILLECFFVLSTFVCSNHYAFKHGKPNHYSTCSLLYQGIFDNTQDNKPTPPCSHRLLGCHSRDVARN